MDITNRDKRTYQPRVLECHQSLKHYVYAVNLIFIAVYVFIVLPVIVITYSAGKGNLVDLLALLAFIPVYFAFYYYLFRPKLIRKIQVFPDYILIQEGKIETEIPFTEIVKLEIISSRKFKVVTKHNKTYRFSSHTERIEYVLDELVKNNNRLIGRDKYNEARKNLLLVDHYLSRHREIFSFKNKIIIGLIVVATGVLLSAMMYYKHVAEVHIYSFFRYFSDTLLFTFSLFAFLLVGFMITTQFIISKHTVKRLKIDRTNKARDVEFEAKVYRRCTVMIFAILMFLSIVTYKFDLNTIRPNFNSTDELTWIDAKYNCSDCKYSLKIGDRVVVKSGTRIGTVVALPRESVVLHHKKESGRYIASESSEVVPVNSFAIKIRDEIILQKNSEIRGKLFNKMPVEF